MFRNRLAIVLSHPTQYYSPWFRHIATSSPIALRVFYLWNFGATEKVDRTFGNSFTWDIPLLEGYEYEFVPNQSFDPGTHHFRGLNCPQLTERVAAWNPSAILLFGYNYWSHLQLLWSRRLAKVPILFRGDSHLLCPADSFRSRVTCQLRRLLFRRFAGALAVGSANRDYLLDSGIPDDRIICAPHCVDNVRFQNAEGTVRQQAGEWRAKLGIPSSAQVVLFAGKFEDKKRPLDLLRAFLNMWNHRQKKIYLTAATPGTATIELAMLFVGSGPQEEELRKLAATSSHVPIFFAPFQNQSQMPMVYAAGDLLVLPSYGRSETWGLAVNEAMNLRLPIIVSSHVGCGPDLVRPGQNGWIFPAGSIGDLESVLGEATSDSARLKRYGEMSRSIIEHYSYDRAADGLMHALNSITLGGASSASAYPLDATFSQNGSERITDLEQLHDR